VSAVTCSSRRQKSPRENDSQIVKYKNIFSTGQEVKKIYSALKELKTHGPCEPLRPVTTLFNSSLSAAHYSRI